MTTALIDDRLLFAAVIGELPNALLTETLMTTPSWWFRLGRAVKEPGRDGPLSRLVAALPAEVAAGIVVAIDTLVPVTTTSPEEVMPFATSLAAEHRLNLLAAEAAATAVLYECAIHVSIDGDNPLRRVAAELGIEYHVTTRKRPPEKRDRQA